ncbi:DUF2634 domain-containing protein [Clostridium beijerinckii]|uniref:DUF2634 domain-containing protein n=1 Tax=Clostridium beijerinckii TaxID=1520 RepID=UPI0009C49DBB|nr:DUF2634 domain-containing protein [Clostridium beijerinckii]NRT78110.1 hypothetical protein [Clostridium beijerinckii]OOM44809.1 hypothetical protein CBEIJ_35550 [Clostridium beijerinckii]
MSILPINSNLTITVSDNNITEYKKYELNKLKEYAWDFKHDRFLLENGKFIIVEDLEALKVRVYKKLKTPKGRKKFLMIYSKNYGLGLEDEIISYSLTDNVKDKIKNVINECLVDGKYINGITYNSITKNDNEGLNVSMILNTKYGTIEYNDLSLGV